MFVELLQHLSRNINKTLIKCSNFESQKILLCVIVCGIFEDNFQVSVYYLMYTCGLILDVVRLQRSNFK